MTPNTLTYSDWPIHPSLPPIPITDVTSPDGSFLARIEHYVNESPYEGHALTQFQNRMDLLRGDLYTYTTVVIDSMSALQEAGVQYHRLTSPYTQSGNIDPRKWYANTKENVQQELIGRLAWVRHQNVVIVAHAGEKVIEVGDEVLRYIEGIGKLSKSLGKSYGEVYRAYMRDELDDKGRPTGHSDYLLQTQASSKWGALSLIGAPNPCPNTWDRLWDNGTPVKPIRCIVYGDFGTGKSAFAATFPTPMLVLAFDPFDKMIHYERITGRVA